MLFKVSCRLCKAKSHVPLSCDEFKKENGVSERRIIEEARTEALIRTCGKCKVRILKEDGCNKVICTKCYAVLCDYCGKDITKQLYNHFDGQGRAPPGVNTDDKSGKCPLYDESHKRKDQQVEKAEKEAMAKVRAEHPDLSEEDLKIKFAKGLQSSTNRHHGHQPHHVDVPHHHNNHHRHYGHEIGEAAVAALYDREPGAAFDAIFQGVGNMLDEFGGIAPHAIQHAREQGRQVGERMTATQQQAMQQQLQLQHHREALLLQQQRAALFQQGAARRTVGLSQAAQTNGARMTAMNGPIFPPIQNRAQAADVPRLRHNDQAFANNAGAQHLSNRDDPRARRQPNVAHRTLEDRSHGLGRVRNPDAPIQRPDINDFRRRPAEINADRAAAERVAGWHRYNRNALDLNLPARMPGEFPQAPRTRNPLPPEAPDPWVAGANHQAYL